MQVPAPPPGRSDPAAGGDYQSDTGQLPHRTTRSLRVGVTPESTSSQHPRPDVRFVPMPEVAVVTVSLTWATERPHPALTDFLATVHRCIAMAADQSRYR
jgi:hypothetical protein